MEGNVAVLWNERVGFLQMDKGLCVIGQGVVEDAEVEMGDGKGGVEFDGQLKISDGLFIIAVDLIGKTEVCLLYTSRCV